jgi:hypothetical protein
MYDFLKSLIKTGLPALGRSAKSLHSDPYGNLKNDHHKSPCRDNPPSPPLPIFANVFVPRNPDAKKLMDLHRVQSESRQRTFKSRPPGAIASQ